MNKFGFTLVEVMMAAMILSLGAVMVHEVFFKSLDTFDYCENYFKIGCWMDDKVWAAQDNLSHSGPSAIVETGGDFNTQNKDFSWNLSYGLVDHSSDLYKIGLDVFWQEGARRFTVSRTAFARYVEKN